MSLTFPRLNLSREFMLERMLAADATFDGQFITGVISTGIYCLPSCKARKPKPASVVFYAAPAQAKAAGLRACLRCKPDQWRNGVYAEEAQFWQALASIQLSETRKVPCLARQFNISVSKLHGLFGLYCHTTPADWLASRRIQQTCTLLLNTQQTVTEIAYSVGFESLSSFGVQFRRKNALSPLSYRQMPQRGGFELRLTDTCLEVSQIEKTWQLPSVACQILLTVSADKIAVHPVAPLTLTKADWQSLHELSLKAAHSGPSPTLKRSLS